MTWDRRRVFAALLALALAAAATAQDAGLAVGLQQIREGDFEAAVISLEAAARRLESEAGQAKAAAQARLHLGVARVALTQLDVAREDFKAALRQDPTLRVGEDRFSPKVVRVFESARQDLAAQAPPEEKKSSKTPLVVIGGLVAAGAGVAIVASGGESPPPAGSASVSNARFATPVILCPNGQVNVALPFTLLVDATNGTAATFSISSVSVQMTIVDSPEVPSEVGQSTIQAGTPLPANIAASASVIVQIQSALLCTNLPGGVSRYNDWTALVTLATSAGSFNLGTGADDRLRVNLP